MEKTAPSKTVASNAAPQRQLRAQPGHIPILPDLVSRLGNRGLQRLRPIQRKCSCGGSCPSCREEEELKIQRKSNGAPPRSHGIALAHDLASRPGQPLEPSLRRDMESRLGADFSAVRIHNDPAAAQASRALQADAFTTGNHIAFAPGKLGSDAASSQLLAHELTHVMQQASGAVPPGYIDSGADDPFERQARTALPRVGDGAQADARGPKTTFTSTHPSAIQRDEASMTSDMPEDVSMADPVFSGVAPDASARDDDIVLEIIREILRHGRFAAFLAESYLEDAWNSFGDRLPTVATANFDLFKRCVDAGMDLDDIDALDGLRHAFADDVRSVALGHLLANRQIIDDEQLRLGLDQPDISSDPMQNEAIEDIQEGAREITRAHEAQAGLRRVPVGYETITSCVEMYCWDAEFPAFFDPQKKPESPPRQTENPPFQSYDEVKKFWDRNEAAIFGLGVKYPVAYGAEVQESLGALTAVSPEQARGVVRRILGTAVAEIDATADRIRENDLKYWDLKPIHQQLFNGESGNGLWSLPFFHLVGEEDVSDQESDEFLENLGIGFLAMIGVAGLILLTGGTAAVALTAGSIAGSAVQAGLSWEKYIDLASAYKANVSPKYALVASGQVSAQFLTATIDSVFLFLDVAAPLWKAARAGAAATRILEREGAEKVLEEMGQAEAKAVAEKGLLELEAAEAVVAEARLAQGGAVKLLRSGRLAICTSPCRYVLDAIRDMRATRGIDPVVENLFSRAQAMEDAYLRAMERGIPRRQLAARFGEGVSSIAQEVDSLAHLASGAEEFAEAGGHFASDASEEFSRMADEAPLASHMGDPLFQGTESVERMMTGTAQHEAVYPRLQAALPEGTFFSEDTLQGLRQATGVELPFAHSTGPDIYVLDHGSRMVHVFDVTANAGVASHVRRLDTQLQAVRAAFAAHGWAVYDEVLELPWTGLSIDQFNSRVLSQLRPFASL